MAGLVPAIQNTRSEFGSLDHRHKGGDGEGEWCSEKLALASENPLHFNLGKG